MKTKSFELSEIAYQGWSRCARLVSSRYELIVTTEVGPRILSFRMTEPKAENLLKQYPEMLGTSGSADWRIYGGHRLWCAPEVREKTYYPDNSPVKVEKRDDAICFVSPVEKNNEIQKEIEISLAGEDIVRVLHRVKNVGENPTNLAPWSLTVMRPGGTAVMPLPARGAHKENLLPTGRFSMWAYTDLSDSRFSWGSEFLFIQQDQSATSPQKIGLYPNNTDFAWLGYVFDDCSMLKSCRVKSGAEYPDLGVAIEVYTNSEMLELETLAPLGTLQPGHHVEHEERWMIGAGVFGGCNDNSVKTGLAPNISSLTASWAKNA